MKITQKKEQEVKPETVYKHIIIILKLITDYLIYFELKLLFFEFTC